jgi:hypothetical protein
MRELVQSLFAFARWLGRTKSESKAFSFLVVLAVLGLTVDGWRSVSDFWREQTRPKAAYRRAVEAGVAVSLNGLEKQGNAGALLPAIDICGVLWDRDNNDWIIFGERAPGRTQLPVDAVAVAIRAVRQEMEPPGIDIRPYRGTSDEASSTQQVTYFGGVQRTVVGRWFFQFDYWMKRNSLGQMDVAFAGLSDYWSDAVAQLEHDIAACQTAQSSEQRRHNRHWLCTDEFKAIDGDGVLTFQETPLLVRAESYVGGLSSWHGAASQGKGSTIDPLAGAYANRITASLPKLAGALPVTQIEDFSRLVAGFAWLANANAYRDLRHWLNAPLALADTPTTVSGLVMRTSREHRMTCAHSSVLHSHSIEMSGGVLVAPSVVRYRVADRSLRCLRKAILHSRPSSSSVIWSFTYLPPTT